MVASIVLVLLFRNCVIAGSSIRRLLFSLLGLFL